MVVCNYVCRDNGKITRKKKLFSYDDVVKSRRNLNFEKMILRLTQEKMMGFDDEYSRSASNKILLRQY